MKRILFKLKNEDGFTLLEMSIVIMVIAALLLLIIPNIGSVNEQTSKTTNSAVVQTVESQKILYKMDFPGHGLSESELLIELEDKGYITEGQLEAYNNIEN